MFSSSVLWQRSFEPQDDPFDDYRQRLKEGLLRLRDRAATLSAEISRDAPFLTVHDITHIDALWEMAELIIGEEQLSASEPFLNPLETFLLGAAFLTHDLAHSLAALGMTEGEVRSHERYIELLHRLRMEKYDDVEKSSPSEEDHRETLQAFLREKHADAAREILLKSWSDDRGTQHYLLSDPDLRESLGERIGLIAASHHWPTSKLQAEFDIIGAPAFMPSSWQCDLLQIASLLRVADVAHIDSRRAPSMLYALRKPKFLSRQHWEFQSRINHPVRREDKILYTSTTSFPLSAIHAWWLCFDTLRYIDRELYSTDNLLLESRRKRFALKGVASVEDPGRLAKNIPTQGWQPVDTEIRVGNVASLVKKLGGEQLYGDDFLAPIRELITNGCDAVRARRLVESLDDSFGTVTVRIVFKDSKYRLQITDDGLGMSRAVLTGPLLDFGNSYWASLEASRELSALSVTKFNPVGRFGVGFFSVFMLGNHVTVSSRRFDAGVADSNILEFIEGPETRPLLRNASGDDFRSVGTRVEIELERSPFDKGGLLRNSRYENPVGSLNEIIAWLYPASPVTIKCQEGDGPIETAVVGGDWRTIESTELLARLEMPRVRPSNDDTVELRKRTAPFIRPLLHSATGIVIGRLAFRLEMRYEETFYRDCAVITVGGARSQDLHGISGVIIGSPRRASRDSAFHLCEGQEIDRWALEQRDLIEASDLDDEVKATVGQRIRGLGLEVNLLPIALSRNGWLNEQQVGAFATNLEEVVVYESHFAEPEQFGAKSYADNFLNIEVARVTTGIKYFSREEAKWTNPSYHSRSTLGLIVRVLAAEWVLSEEDILRSAEHSTQEFTTRAIIGKDRHDDPVEMDDVVIFRRTRRR